MTKIDTMLLDDGQQLHRINMIIRIGMNFRAKPN